jgi:hypothetical protein
MLWEVLALDKRVWLLCMLQHWQCGQGLTRQSWQAAFV